MVVVGALNITMNFLLLIASHIFRIYILRTNKRLNSDSITSAYFTVLVTNLPTDKDETQIKQFFEKITDNSVEVVKINFTYMIDELVKLGAKKSRL